MDSVIPFSAGDVNRYEIYRYLGIRGAGPDEATKALVTDCLDELMEKISPRSFSSEYPLTLSGDGGIDFTCFKTSSKSLLKNLEGCSRVVLFAATLGDGADFLIHKYERVRMSRAAVMQAASAAMVEAYCDVINSGLRERYKKENSSLKPRFSPGYGDFALENQRYFMDALRLDRTVGIRLTDGYLMLPTKSVTAVIGIVDNHE